MLGKARLCVDIGGIGVWYEPWKIYIYTSSTENIHNMLVFVFRIPIVVVVGAKCAYVPEKMLFAVCSVGCVFFLCTYCRRRKLQLYGCLSLSKWDETFGGL